MRVKASKNEFRKESIASLKIFLKHKKYKKDKLVIEELYKFIKKSKAKRVMLYLPLKLEVDIYPLIKKLREEKVELLVPFMEGKSFRLVKYRLPLESRKFGLKEPKYSKQHINKKIDIAIVPIVGMDATFRRVGFGKGMYDRFFEKEIKNINKIVFVARKLCYSKNIITDHYDVKADMVIVP